MSNRIIVVVRGGLVQTVYANVDNVSVDVLDYDSLEEGDTFDWEQELYEKLDKEKDELTEVY